MTILKSFAALIHGLNYCLFFRPVRMLAIIPWLIGLISYPLALWTVAHFHPLMMQWVSSDPSGILRTLLFYLAWIVFALLLLLLAGLASLLVVMILASVFQTMIARTVLTELGRDVPPEDSSLKGTARETWRTIKVELLKLIWLLPVLAMLLIVGIVPFLAPLAFIGSAWVMGYQFVDVVLDIYRISVWQRLRFALVNPIPVACFGATLTLCWLIPLLGIVIPPVAAAGAAWLMSETKLLDGYSQRLQAQEEG